MFIKGIAIFLQFILLQSANEIKAKRATLLLLGHPLCYIVQTSSSLNLGCNKFVSLAMNVDDFDRIIGFQMFAQFCNVHIHTASIEIIIISPYSLQRKISLQYLILMSTKQTQKL